MTSPHRSPKWYGKSWTSFHHAKSKFLVADSANIFSNRALAKADPEFVLEGATPRLIDEWQEAPLLWDTTRSYIDHKGEKGQIILTGFPPRSHRRKTISLSGLQRW